MLGRKSSATAARGLCVIQFPVADWVCGVGQRFGPRGPLLPAPTQPTPTRSPARLGRLRGAGCALVPRVRADAPDPGGSPRTVREGADGPNDAGQIDAQSKGSFRGRLRKPAAPSLTCLGCPSPARFGSVGAGGRCQDPGGRPQLLLACPPQVPSRMNCASRVSPWRTGPLRAEAAQPAVPWVWGRPALPALRRRTRVGEQKPVPGQVRGARGGNKREPRGDLASRTPGREGIHRVPNCSARLGGAGSGSPFGFWHTGVRVRPGGR